MDNRGQYGVLTSFLLIVVIVGLMIYLTYFNSLRITEPNYIVNKYSTNLQKMDNDFNSIVSCLNVLNQDSLSSDESTQKCLPGGLKGYQLNVFYLYDCGAVNYTIGAFTDCHQKFIYLTNYLQNGQVCLSQMELCQ